MLKTGQRGAGNGSLHWLISSLYPWRGLTMKKFPELKSPDSVGGGDQERNLGALSPGTICDVVRVSGPSKELCLALLSFGIVPGTRIEILHTAPLDDPITIRLRGFFLSLRRQEANSVYVCIVTK